MRLTTLKSSDNDSSHLLTLNYRSLIIHAKQEKKERKCRRIRETRKRTIKKVLFFPPTWLEDCFIIRAMTRTFLLPPPFENVSRVLQNKEAFIG